MASRTRVAVESRAVSPERGKTRIQALVVDPCGETGPVPVEIADGIVDRLGPHDPGNRGRRQHGLDDSLTLQGVQRAVGAFLLPAVDAHLDHAAATCQHVEARRCHHLADLGPFGGGARGVDEEAFRDNHVFGGGLSGGG